MPYYLCARCKVSYNTEEEALECERQHNKQPRAKLPKDTMYYKMASHPSLLECMKLIIKEIEDIYKEIVPKNEDSYYEYEYFDIQDLSINWVDTEWVITYYYIPTN